MTKQEYRDKLERCQLALDGIVDDFASPEAKDAAINALRFHFELARELYLLDKGKEPDNE